MISILIPIYNGIEFIEESVGSVISQTYGDWELLIGINGHPPDSEVYMKAKEYENKDSRIRVFDFHTIKGKSNTLNELLKYARFDFIAILDVDDIWHYMKLEVQAKFIPSYDVVGSQCIYFGEMEGISPKIPLYDLSNFNFKSFNPVINSSSIIKKELCYWNNKWDGVEDYDLWLTLKKHNRKFYNCPEILVKHRIHRQSSFNSKGNNNRVGELLSNY